MAIPNCFTVVWAPPSKFPSDGRFGQQSVNGVYRSDVLVEVRNIQNGQLARCSLNLGFGSHEKVFEIVPLVVNSVRKAIDDGAVRFYPAQEYQDTYPQIPRYEPPSVCSQSEVVQFLTGKAYLLGFMATDVLSVIWAVDPWDENILA
jgi:hypothetical protein